MEKPITHYVSYSTMVAMSPLKDHGGGKPWWLRIMSQMSTWLIDTFCGGDKVFKVVVLLNESVLEEAVEINAEVFYKIYIYIFFFSPH